MLPLANHLVAIDSVCHCGVADHPDVAKEPGRRTASVVAGCVGKVPRPVFSPGGYRQSLSMGDVTVTTPPAVSMIVETISQPFSASVPSVVPPGTTSAPQASRIPAVLIGVWICGIAASLFWWLIRWRQVRRAVRSGVAFRSRWTR